MLNQSLTASFMGPTWGPSGADRSQMGPLLAPWSLLSGVASKSRVHKKTILVLVTTEMFLQYRRWHPASVMLIKTRREQKQRRVLDFRDLTMIAMQMLSNREGHHSGWWCHAWRCNWLFDRWRSIILWVDKKVITYKTLREMSNDYTYYRAIKRKLTDQNVH